MRRLLLAAALAILTSGSALAGAIEVMHPWARPTIPNRPGVVYLGIHNNGAVPDRLVAAHADGVESVEIHLAQQKDGVMTMAPVDAIEVPAGGMADLEPGGYHMMLFGLAKPLKEGDTLDLTLTFESAGDVAVRVPVTGAAPEMGQNGQMQHGSGHGHSQGTGN